MKKISHLAVMLAIATSGVAQATDFVTTIGGPQYTNPANGDGVTGTMTFSDWGFIGPYGRTALDFEHLNGFGNGMLDPAAPAFCLADPAACDIGQMQHVVTNDADGLTADRPHTAYASLTNDPEWTNANVDAVTTFYKWAFNSGGGSRFSNMLIDLDGDYHVAKNDMKFEFYNVLKYRQIGTEGATPDQDWSNSLAFHPYALTDGKGWCGSIEATHPGTLEAMAGQITFDVAFDVYFNLGDYDGDGVNSYSYMNTEIVRDFEMRSYGDLHIDVTTTLGDRQVMDARAIVNNTSPVDPMYAAGSTPVISIDMPVDENFYNTVSFMGGGVTDYNQNCVVLNEVWNNFGVQGVNFGPGIDKIDHVLDVPQGPNFTTECATAGGVVQNHAFSEYAFILRADGNRFVDWFDEATYGPNPIDTEADAVMAWNDNCTNVANADQQDTDADGYGNACDADFNNDNIVNSLDLGLFKQMFFSSGDVMADLNADGIVNSLDIGLFKSKFFQAPGPSQVAVNQGLKMTNKINAFKGNLNMTNKFYILLGTLLFVFSTLVNAGANVSFSEHAVKSRTGNTFTLDVLMSGFPTTEGGGLVLHFNSRKLQVTNVTVDTSVWNFVNKVGDIDNTNGTISDILFSSYQGVIGSAKIATIEFQAIHKGKGKITMEESTVNPFSSNGQNINVTFTPTKVRIRR